MIGNLLYFLIFYLNNTFIIITFLNFNQIKLNCILFFISTNSKDSSYGLVSQLCCFFPFQYMEENRRNSTKMEKLQKKFDYDNLRHFKIVKMQNICCILLIFFGNYKNARQSAYSHKIHLKTYIFYSAWCVFFTATIFCATKCFMSNFDFIFATVSNCH